MRVVAADGALSSALWSACHRVAKLAMPIPTKARKMHVATIAVVCRGGVSKWAGGRYGTYGVHAGGIGVEEMGAADDEGPEGAADAESPWCGATVGVEPVWCISCPDGAGPSVAAEGSAGSAGDSADGAPVGSA